MDVRALLASAAAGDQAAWDALVERYTGLLWSIARGYGFGAADAADAVQMTWLRLVERLDSIVDPERLPAWLSTTVRRECLQLLRRTRREPPRGVFDPTAEPVDPTAPVDDVLLRAERDTALWRALATLSERCQRLLRVLMASPPPAYAEVSAALDIPVGSIGPTRQRCLTQLRAVVLADEVLGAELAEGGGRDR
ncbi:RNA polymerase sigma factor [Actinokineospora sp. 24-640]